MNDQQRILIQYCRLLKGERLFKSKLSKEFDISSRTIQRDINNILIPFLGESLSFNRKGNYYSLKKNPSLNKKEVLILIKVLLESRSLTKKENSETINNLLNVLDINEQREVKKIINSEWLNYIPIRHSKDIINKIWELSEYIQNNQSMMIEYNSLKTYQFVPTSIFFDHFYYYLVGYQPFHKINLTLRIDKITNFNADYSENISVTHGEKYRDGDERNYKVDANRGVMRTITVECYTDFSIIEDKFINTKIINKGNRILEFTSQHTDGLIRWILSQGDGIKVISPDIIVNELKDNFIRLSNLYNKKSD